MAGMGKRSLTKKSWKTQKCFATTVQFVGRKAKRSTKSRNASTLRQQPLARLHGSLRLPAIHDHPLATDHPRHAEGTGQAQRRPACGLPLIFG